MLKRLAGLLKSPQQGLFEGEPAPAAAPEKPRRLALAGQPVDYELRRARRRSIGFTVTTEGLKVSAPRWVAIAEIEQALHGKADWILRKLVEQRERARRIEAGRVVWADGASLPYLGEPLRLRLGGLARFDPEARELHLGLPADCEPARLREATRTWLHGRARALFEQRCRHYAAAMGVRYSKLSLSSALTRWGSASANGAIRLNWRLIHYPAAVIDYVVVHELAHLREMNHSPRFWAIVGAVLPDYEAARERLRDEPPPVLE